MMKTLFKTLAAGGLLAATALSAHAGLVGSTVNLKFYFPDSSTVFCDSGNAVVGAGVEFPAGCSGFSPVSIDITDFGFTVNTGGSTWAGGAFNGIVKGGRDRACESRFRAPLRALV